MEQKDRYLTEQELYQLPLKQDVVKAVVKKLRPASVKNGIKYYSLANFQYFLGLKFSVSLVFDNNFIQLDNRKDPLVNVMYGEHLESLKNIILCTIGFFPNLNKTQIPYVVKFVLFLLYKNSKLASEMILEKTLNFYWKTIVFQIIDKLAEEKKIEFLYKKNKNYNNVYRYRVLTDNVTTSGKVYNIVTRISFVPKTREDFATIDFMIYSKGYACSKKYLYCFMEKALPNGPAIEKLNMMVGMKLAKAIKKEVEKQRIANEKSRFTFRTNPIVK